MATAHALSVFTNSSVRQPVNPKSGLTNTLHERPIAVWEERYDSHDDDGFLAGSSGAAGGGSGGAAPTPTQQRAAAQLTAGSQLSSAPISPRDPLIESLTKDLSRMTDDEFYSRLQEVKAEHKKTVAMCEQAYRTALAGTSAPIAMAPRASDATAALAESPASRAPADRVRDMSRPPLPPEARQRRAWARRSHSGERTDDSASGDESDSGRQRSASVSRSPPAGDRQRPRSGSLSSSVSTGMARVEDMWENFSVDDYAPKSQGGGSMSSLRDAGTGWKQQRPVSESSSSNKENSAKEWSPKITMPQPFRMTVRDEAKTTKKRTKAQEEVDRSIKEKRLQEEAECQKKFKATPAPANIYLPLYDEIMESQQTRRDLNHVHRSELLRSMEKPFKFLQREEQKKRSKRTQSVPEAEAAFDEHLREKAKFKAQPIPKEVREEMLDRLAEEEEYRRIRMRMRAEDMLRSARLPPSMEAREMGRAVTLRASASEDDVSDNATGRRQGTERLPGEPTFRPKIKHEVPDFEELHRKLQWELAKRKDEKEATVAKPFTLRTDRITSHVDKIHDDIEKDEKTLTELRWPYKNPRTKPKSIGVVNRTPDQIPAMQTTASTELRKSSTKEKLSELSRRELQELEELRRSREYDRKLKNAISEKVAANEIIYNLKDQTSEKLRRYRAEEKARQEEYQKHLNEMKQRVDSRPLLFEMVTQKNARMQAEKKYDSTLKSAGLHDKFVKEKAAAAAAKADGNDVDDDDEDRLYKTDDDTGSYRESLRRTSRLEEARRPPLSKEETGLSDGDNSSEGDDSA